MLLFETNLPMSAWDALISGIMAALPSARGPQVCSPDRALYAHMLSRAPHYPARRKLRFVRLIAGINLRFIAGTGDPAYERRSLSAHQLPKSARLVKISCFLWKTLRKAPSFGECNFHLNSWNSWKISRLTLDQNLFCGRTIGKTSFVFLRLSKVLFSYGSWCY